MKKIERYKIEGLHPVTKKKVTVKATQKELTLGQDLALLDLLDGFSLEALMLEGRNALLRFLFDGGIFGEFMDIIIQTESGERLTSQVDLNTTGNSFIVPAVAHFFSLNGPAMRPLTGFFQKKDLQEVTMEFFSNLIVSLRKTAAIQQSRESGKESP